MTIGSQSHPERWPPVQQLIPSGWCRTGSVWGSDGPEWGLRMAQLGDPETTLRRWISSVEEHDVEQRSGTDGSSQRTDVPREAMDVF